MLLSTKRLRLFTTTLRDLWSCYSSLNSADFSLLIEVTLRWVHSKKNPIWSRIFGNLAANPATMSLCHQE